jgi:hypothetical protein
VTPAGSALLREFNARHPVLSGVSPGHPAVAAGVANPSQPAVPPPELVGPDIAFGVAVDPDNFAYVVGSMTNLDGSTDAFVSRVDPYCNVLCTRIISNFFEQSGPDYAFGVAVTPADNDAYDAYVVGEMAGPAGTTRAFVARVDPSCSTLNIGIIPNYFGFTAGADDARGVSVDNGDGVGQGNTAYVVGEMSDPAGYPFAFVARYAPNCTPIPGSINPIPNPSGGLSPGCAYGVSVAPDNDVYVVGDMSFRSSSAFVARVDPFCSWLGTGFIPNLCGAAGPDCAYGVSVTPDDNAYVVGSMSDTAGGYNAFVARVDPSCWPFCSSLITNPAGGTTGAAYGVSAGPDGLAYVAGCYLSPDGSTNAFVARVDPVCSTLYTMPVPNFFDVSGGPDCGNGIAVGSDNNAYVAGNMANPTGFWSAFVARADPSCNIPYENEIHNYYGK